MSDATYQPKVYRDKGGDRMVVKYGGQILVEPGGSVMGGNPSGAADYFVDLNVSATGDGSMDSPFATIAEAITASNTSIGLTANRWWARRNRIFVMGDGIEESLTVLPEKCDIIGCGSDLYPFPRIIGAHTIAVAKVGCRFINMGWQASGAGDMFALPAGCHGFQILGGWAQPSVAGNTKAFEITDCANVDIRGLVIQQNPGAYGTGIFGVGIDIQGVASNHQTIIDGVQIEATKGIYFVASAPAYGSAIKNSLIKATGMVIQDVSDVVQVVNNNLISAANDDGSGTGASADAIVCNTSLAAGNRLTCGDHLNAPFPIEGTLT